MNDLQRYFESNQGRLIHKWVHYFDIYDRHFSRFRNTDVHILEIGLFQGGSLQMWRNYFGSDAKIIGIDIDPRCKEFEEEGTDVLIGSQEDRAFLAEVRLQYPRVDILIDDGGHTMRQQITTFEELFPHIRENGVYLCEDLHTSYWGDHQGGFRKPTNFIEYSKNFIDNLNAWHSRDPESFQVTDFTRQAYSMNYYDSVLVIEKQIISPPTDQMTGHLSIESPEAQKLQELYNSGQSIPLSSEVGAASAEGRYAQLNGRYFEMVKAYQDAQTHIRNLDNALSETRQGLADSRLHIQNLEAALAHYQQQQVVLEDQLKLNQAALETNQEALQQVSAESEQRQALLEHFKSELQSRRVELEAKAANLQSKVKRVRGRLANSQAALQHTRDEITAMKTSKFWRLRSAWMRFKGVFGWREQPFPEFSAVLLGNESFSEQVAQPLKMPEGQPAVPYNLDLAYELWIKRHTPTEADLKDFAATVKIFAAHPLISVIMPVYNPPIQFLKEAIESVMRQVYPYWELCIADDASPDAEVRQVLEEYAQADERVKVVFREQNGHISKSSNSALELATGEFIALLDHDDVLAPEALYEMALMLNKQPEADMIYSDEDKINAANQRKYPFFKPDWCPDSFLSRMYTCHLGVYRRSLITEIGGFRVGFEGSQDYDLVLRLTEKTDHIFHVPKVLYHWRMHEESTASGDAAKPYAYEAGQRAIEEALQRRGEPGDVLEHPKCRGHYTVRYEIKSYDLVSIIIPTRDLGRLLNQCLDSIFEKSTYPNYEVIVVDNGSTEPYTEKLISDWLNREPSRFRCYSYNIPFNYSKINNYGVSKAQGKYVLFLNNDTEVIVSDWIEAMVEQAQRPTIGAVGARLLYPDDTIQHAGVVLGIGGVAGHLHKYADATAVGCLRSLVDTLNYSAVTAACLMCRRDVFEAAGGFNEELAIAFNDVDFCLRILKAGFRNICLPHAKLYHYESKSRGYEDTPEKQMRFKQEIDYMGDRWGSTLEHDPCYSPNLSLKHEDCRIQESPESEAQLELALQLRQTRNVLKRVRKRLEEKNLEIEATQGQIEAMKTSKFWKLRSRWFGVKKMLGLATQEGK
jgi:O-antigen biosynthesis protein